MSRTHKSKPYRDKTKGNEVLFKPRNPYHVHTLFKGHKVEPNLKAKRLKNLCRNKGVSIDE